MSGGGAEELAAIEVESINERRRERLAALMPNPAWTVAEIRQYANTVVGFWPSEGGVVVKTREDFLRAMFEYVVGLLEKERGCELHEDCVESNARRKHVAVACLEEQQRAGAGIVPHRMVVPVTTGTNYAVTIGAAVEPATENPRGRKR